MTGLHPILGFAPLTLVGAAAMTFGAAYVRGLTGFGMAIILVPLLGLIIAPGEAVVLGILLQLLMWYLLFTELLPASTEPMVLGPLFLSKGGLNFPIPIWASGHVWAAGGLVVGMGLAWWQRRRAIAATALSRPAPR